MEYARAKKVLDRHQESIWRYPGVQGMGIEGAPGAEDGGREPSPEPLFRIVVHVDTRADVPDAPRSVEGVPLRFTVSGEFTAQPAPAG
ncbi:hypothetical protein [Streptomyces phytophilus]|uniref:hypothetical protein n=1 Tax=Streptomyces phytophilus TaxID=722715 RepID=UPI0015F0E6B8|nr:hypothetical protein [Streptomyces phytophilus]